MNWNHVIGIVAVVASATSVEAVAAEPVDLAAKADAIIKAAYPADGPGGAVIITRGGQTIYTGGRGLADLEARKTITPETLFRLGSITKQFTAAVILQLVQEGRIALDDPIFRFFPDFPQPGASATVRHLLNHTSGIQSFDDWKGLNRPHTTTEMIARFRDLPPLNSPGQVWKYNNSGYVLLGGIIEQMTGKLWHEAIEERIARPLGLQTIGHGLDRESGTGMAQGYNLSDGAVEPAQRVHILHAGGGLLGTVGDMAKWAHALHHGRIVNPALYEAMISPTTLPGGKSRSYGFGTEIEEVRGRRVIGHSGGVPGFVTDSIYIPSEDLFVAVFTNNSPPPILPMMTSKRLAALALGEPFPEFTRAEVPQQILAPLFGDYKMGEGKTRHFYARDSKLFTMLEGSSETEVFAAGNDHFFYGPKTFTWFRIERRPDGDHVMEMHQQGDQQAERAVRTGDLAPPVAVDLATLQSYVGGYTAKGVTVTIAIGESGLLTVQLGQQPALPIRPVSKTEFLVEQVNGRIVFHPEDGAVNRLAMHQGGRQIEARRAP